MSAPAPTSQIEVRPDKRLATRRARAALWGATLLASEDDRGRPIYIVNRWALIRAFADLDQVDEFLRQVGAPE